MDPTSTGRRSRSRKTRPKSNIYSTVVIHGDGDDDDDSSSESDHEQKKRSKAQTREQERQQEEDLYDIMVYKDDDDDEDDSSLPPLLKRLPKDFGGGAPVDDDDDNADFGTMIVKTDRTRPSNLSSPSSYSPSKSRSSPLSEYKPARPGNRNDEDEGEGDGDGDEFSTFVVRSTVRASERESVSGTVLRRTGVKGMGDSTMGRAVASMQAVGDLRFAVQRKGSGSSQGAGEEGRYPLMTKMSSSSIPESVTREDPTTKYELLNELGRCCKV
jgi:hypothetical protein